MAYNIVITVRLLKDESTFMVKCHYTIIMSFNKDDFPKFRMPGKRFYLSYTLDIIILLHNHNWNIDLQIYSYLLSSGKPVRSLAILLNSINWSHFIMLQ